jgi:hypothetical protein
MDSKQFVQRIRHSSTDPEEFVKGFTLVRKTDSEKFVHCIQSTLLNSLTAMFSTYSDLHKN